MKNYFKNVLNVILLCTENEGLTVNFASIIRVINAVKGVNRNILITTENITKNLKGTVKFLRKKFLNWKTVNVSYCVLLD